MKIKENENRTRALPLSHPTSISASLSQSLDSTTLMLSRSPIPHPSLFPLSFSFSASLSLPLDSTAVSSNLQQPTALSSSPIGDPSVTHHPPSPFILLLKPTPALHLPPLLAGSSSREPSTHPRTHFTPVCLPVLPRDSLPRASHRPPFISHCPPSPFIPLPRPTLIPSSPTASRKSLGFLSLDLPPMRHLRSIQVARWTMMPPRTNSFKASSNNTTIVGSNAFKSRPDRPRNHQLTDLVQDIHPDFAENGVFSNEMGDLDYEWKF
ncbi:hypothetical protein ACLOJK_029053 [Asimina triloba]